MISWTFRKCDSAKTSDKIFRNLPGQVSRSRTGRNIMNMQGSRTVKKVIQFDRNFNFYFVLFCNPECLIIGSIYPDLPDSTERMPVAANMICYNLRRLG